MSIVPPIQKSGEGSVVVQGSILQSCLQTGKHWIVNTGLAIDHECILEDDEHALTRCQITWQCGSGEGS